MPEFRVTWTIDIDAETPEAAAREARAIQLRSDSTATIYKVSPAGAPDDDCEEFDLNALAVIGNGQHGRAAIIEPSMIQFAMVSGLNVALTGDGPQTVATDFIANVLHWVTLNDPDGRASALQAIVRAVGNYTSETFVDYRTDPEGLGPHAKVRLEVAADGQVWSATVGAAGDLPPEIIADAFEVAV